jgi:cell division protein FtsL
MVRVLNFLCVACMGLAILALYHVSEATRVARVELSQVGHQIEDTKTQVSVLQTEWERVAGPARVQELAERQGMTDTASAELSAFDLLPRRGEQAPLDNAPLRKANAVVPAQPAPPPASASGM